MKFCPDCGTGHECSAEIAADRTDLAIARVQAERDIELARINAGAAKAIAETEAENSSEHAEGVAEGMETALDAVSGSGDDEPPADPVVVQAEADEEPEPEPGPDNEPPVVEIPDPAPKSSGGYWAGYR